MKRNVVFERVGRERVRPPRRYTLNILGITAGGTAAEWWMEFLATIAFAVLMGLVTLILVLWS